MVAEGLCGRTLPLTSVLEVAVRVLLRSMPLERFFRTFLASKGF